MGHRKDQKHPLKEKPEKVCLEGQRCFGRFWCRQCHHQWNSGNSWQGFGQECKFCLIIVYPHKLRPLRRSKNRKRDKKLPHLEDLCQMCKWLGYTCTRKAQTQIRHSAKTTTER